MNKYRSFEWFVIYYWFLTVFIDYSTTSYNNTGIKYYLLLIPIALFIILNLGNIFVRRLSFESSYLIVFLLISSLFSLIKLDFDAIIDIMIWTLPILIIQNSDMKVNIKIVNRMFILTIIAGVIFYHIGISDFGYLPGQTSRNLHQGLWWRVSIFPYRTPPATGMFSLVLIFLNYFKNENKKTRKIFLLLGSYFLVLSGSRTSLLILLVIIATFFLRRTIGLQGRLLSKFIIIMPITMFLLIFIFPNLLLKLDLDSKFLTSLVFRNTEKLSSIEDLYNTLNRQNIWRQYVDIYKTSPIIGAHSNVVNSVRQSETILLKFLAQYGISIIFLLLFFYSKAKQSIQKNNYFRFSVVNILVILMVSYSSFLMPYNFIYLLLFGLLAY